MAGAYLAVAMVSTVAVAVRLARRLAPGDALTAWTAGVLLAISQAVGVSIVLGVVGLLSRAPVALAHVAVAALVLFTVRPAPPAPGRERPAWSAPGLLALGLGGLLTLIAAAPVLDGIVPGDFDTRHYHVVHAASWLQRGSIRELPYQSPPYTDATNPGDGELLGLWLGLPAHGDELMYLGTIPFAMLAVLAVAVAVRALGGSPSIGALAGLALVAAPASFKWNAYTMGTDVAAAAGLAAATAFMLLAAAAWEPRWLALAGAGLGVALGSKYTALVPGALLLVWAAVAVRPWRRLLWLAPGLLLLAAPWYVRNLVHAGNPIFPLGVEIAGLEILPGPQSPIEQNYVSLAARLLELRADALRAWAGFVARLYGPLVLIPLVGVALAWRRGALRRHRVPIAVLAVGSALAYVVTPSTGGGPSGTDPALLEASVRYALPAVLFGTILAASAPRAYLVVAALTVAAVAFDVGWIALESPLFPHPPRLAVMLLLVAAAVAAMAFRPLWSQQLVPRVTALVPRPLVTAAVAVGSVALLSVSAGVVLWNFDRRTVPTQLESSAREARPFGAPFVVMTVADVRSVLGLRLDLPIVSLSAGGRTGERPFADAAAFERALEASGHRVLVIAEPYPLGTESPEERRGWTAELPARWCRVGGGTLYPPWATGIYVRVMAGARC